METVLRQLEAFIAGMAPDDRVVAVRYLNGLIDVLGRYHMTLTAGALLKCLSSAGVAHTAGTMDRWWARVCAKAQEIGPHVANIFSVPAH